LWRRTGIIVGAIVAVALMRLVSALLVGVRATDPATFATMAMAFLAIATLASWLPARRAARVDPTIALRDS
jgi:putative ABC transport system permease protein